MVQSVQGVNVKTNNVFLLAAEEVVRINISIPGMHLITRIIILQLLLLLIMMKTGMEI